LRAICSFIEVTIEGDVDALIGPVECKRTVHTIFIIGVIRAEHDHVVAEPQLSVNDLSGLLSHEMPLKLERSLKPIDRRLWVTVSQGRKKFWHLRLLGRRSLAPNMAAFAVAE